MLNILITGASGFIGSFLVEEALKRNYQVFAGIRRTSSREYLQDPSIKFIEFDFSSVSSILLTLEACKEKNMRFHYIIHNAGVTKAQKKGDYYRVNFLNTKNFIEALKQAGMIPEKFIFTSSLAAYGPGNPVTMEPVRLSDIPHPVEFYGKSKLEAEKYIQSQLNFPWIIIRPTGVYGPREKDYFVFFQAMNRGFETYIGSTQQVLTFIYVKDLVRVIFDMLPSPVTQKSYFVTDGNEYETIHFAAITRKHLKKKTIRIVVPLRLAKQIAFGLEKIYGMWGQVPTLNNDKYQVLTSRNWKCEIEALEKDFGFKAEYDLDKGVEETIQWYRNNKWL